MRAIVVVYAGSVEGVVVVNDDEAAAVLDRLTTVNANAEDPVDRIVNLKVDTVDDVVAYLESS